MTRAWFIGLLVFGGVAGFLSTELIAHLGSPSPAALLPTYGELPEFSLIDQDGRTWTRQGLAGRVWVADFIFTRCAGQCPVMTSQMAKLQSALASVPEVDLVSISVDPSFDTPAVLARYAQHAGARAQRWHFLTGADAAVRALAQQGFHLSVAEGVSAREPIAHSVKLVLVDRQARLRGYYDGTDPSAVAQLTTDARRLAATGSGR